MDFFPVSTKLSSDKTFSSTGCQSPLVSDGVVSSKSDIIKVELLT